MASALNNKSVSPTDEALAAVLSTAKPFWDEIINHIKTTYKNPSEEWKFYGIKSGWTLAVLSNKRRLINMIPLNNCFQAIFTLSEKAANLARTANLPETVKSLIPDQAKCVCGYGLVLDIKTKADIESAKKLLEIKEPN